MSRKVSAGGSQAFQSLKNATGTGAGSILDVSSVVGGVTYKDWALQVVLTGSPAAAIVVLEVCLDYNPNDPTSGHWTTVATWDVTAPHASGDIVQQLAKLGGYARANLTTLTGGTSPTVSAWIAGY